MLRNSRLILAINGIILIISGLSFFIFAERITLMMFPDISSNPQAIEVGLILRYLMGAGSLSIGIILFLARISVRSAAQRVLLGSGIGFIIVFFTAVYVYIFHKTNVPFIALSVYLILGLLSIYVSTRKFQK